jgi:hypothetical protein
LPDRHSDFHAEIIGGTEEGYQVRVSLEDGDVITIVNGPLQRHVRERHSLLASSLTVEATSFPPSSYPQRQPIEVGQSLRGYGRLREGI